MKKLFILIFITLFSLPAFGQENLNTKWILSIDFGIQGHDKRLFDFPNTFLIESWLAMHPETFGTYQLGINVTRSIFNKESFDLFIGVGLSSELSTFTRPFDHNYKQEGGTDILRFTSRYYQNLIQLPIKSKFRIAKNFGLLFEVLPQFNFLTIADNTKNGVPTYSWWRFDFYSVEINPGIEFTTSKIDFGLKYRFFQVKEIDKILFNRTLKDPRTEQVFETENPFKLWFSIGYKF